MISNGLVQAQGPVPEARTAAQLGRLRVWNVAVGIILGAQAIVVATLTNSFSLPVTATFMTGPPGSTTQRHHLFDVPVGWGVVAFLAISAASLLTIASRGVFGWYARNLLKGRNYGRWMEYSVSSSLMIVLISMIVGVSDIAALIAVFGVNAAMILFGLLMEKYESPGKPSWLSFWFGSVAGMIPWIGVAIYLWAPGVNSSPPGFVYGIFFSLFAFFMVFALNMVLQYRKIGPWRDYLYGEKAYIVLSLTAKALLAWQVFFPVLALKK
jgi:hypothetical protein